MIPGEGAGVLVLETLERARRRGARVYAEVAGYGLSCDAHHMTAAHPEGEGRRARAMERALADAGAPAEEVELHQRPRHRHPDQRPARDPGGQAGLRRRRRRMPISSIKSMIGHTMGAASAHRGRGLLPRRSPSGAVPPTINFREPDPECDLDYVPNTARELPVEWR